MTHLDDAVLIEAARNALERPSDFGYWGDLPLFETWGILPFTRSDSSDALIRSNFRSILAHLEGAAGWECESGDNADDPSGFVDTFGVSGFFGRLDHMACRVLVDEDGPLEPSNFTKTFIAAVEISDALREYPIYDESDFWELEWEECEQAFDDAWNSIDWEEFGPHSDDEELKSLVYQDLTEHETPDWFDPQDIESAILDRVREEAWADYAETYKDQMALF